MDGVTGLAVDNPVAQAPGARSRKLRRDGDRLHAVSVGQLRRVERRESGAGTGRSRARLLARRTYRARQGDAAAFGGARPGQSRSGERSLKMPRLGRWGHTDRPSAEWTCPVPSTLLQIDRLCAPPRVGAQPTPAAGTTCSTGRGAKGSRGCGGPRSHGKRVVIFRRRRMAARAAVGVRNRGCRAAVIESEGRALSPRRPAAFPACCCVPATAAA